MDTKSSQDSVTLQNVSILQNELLASTARQMARDMRFYAIVYIIFGALYCLSILGAIIGVPIIIYNLKLKESADQFENFIRSRDFFELQKAFENQRKFFFFNKVLIIIGLVLMVLYILFFIWFGASLFMNMPEGSFA